MGFYFHDTDLPRYEPLLQIDQFTSEILPLLNKSKIAVVAILAVIDMLLQNI